MSEIDIKDAVQGLGEAFEEFKKANDEKLDALEAGKGSDPLQDEKIANIEAKLDSLVESAVHISDDEADDLEEEECNGVDPRDAGFLSSDDEDGSSDGDNGGGLPA